MKPKKDGMLNLITKGLLGRPYLLVIHTLHFPNPQCLLYKGSKAALGEHYPSNMD